MCRHHIRIMYVVPIYGIGSPIRSSHPADVCIKNISQLSFFSKSVDSQWPIFISIICMTVCVRTNSMYILAHPPYLLSYPGRRPAGRVLVWSAEFHAFESHLGQLFFPRNKLSCPGCNWLFAFALLWLHCYTCIYLAWSERLWWFNCPGLLLSL